ncbi:MAG TPA: pyridoxal phosphate-dependent aminotransferase [Alphaproteobacteria bacterium]|nr:pyridoxal phosphate-dependent aminotransferase [Alphaproteobacteria bacterium]
MFTPIDTWFSLHRKASPTAASASLRKKLSDAGADMIDLGQGREQVEWPLAKEALSQMNGFNINSDYNSSPAALNAIAANWIRRMLHVEATPNTTFSIQQTGRNGLDAAFHVIAQSPPTTHSEMLMPEMYWPMIDTTLKRAGLRPHFYKMEPGQYAKDIEIQLESYGDRIAGIYLNSPHNPSGQIMTSQDIADIFAVVNEYNNAHNLRYRHNHKVGIVMDNPYAHVCPEKMEGNTRSLDTGLEAFTLDQITPWMMPISMSKSFGMASPGFSLVAAHPEYTDALTENFMATSCISYSPQFFEAMKTLLGEDKADSTLDHFAGLREKYHVNRAALETAFGDAVLEGAPGMIGVVKVDLRDYIGKSVAKPDGSEFTIQNGHDLVEYLANKAGVATVWQETEPSKLLKAHRWEGLRLSAAETPERYAEGIHRVREGLAALNPQPSAEPQRQMPPAEEIHAAAN